MIRRSGLGVLFVILLLGTFLPLISASIADMNAFSGLPLASTVASSWNPKVTCTPLVVRISDITANQTQQSSFSTSAFNPGISTTVLNGVAKRWLTPGSTPPGWVSPGPSCTVTNSRGTTSLFVEIDGIGRSSMTNEDWSTLYDTTNGGNTHPAMNTSDTTFNLYDPALVPNYSNSCTSAADHTCYGRIHAEVDHDWKAAGYCGTGTFCDNSTLAAQTSPNSTRIDVQGFVYWDPGNLNATWHQFNGWELHPLTAWKLSSTPPPPSLTVSFSESPSGPQVGQTVTLSGSVSGGTAPYSFNWNFGDGSTAISTSSQTTHTYNAQGTFSVTLTVRDSSGLTGQGSGTVAVSNPLAQDFAISTSISTLSFNAGAAGSSTIQVASLNSFAGTVTLSESMSPSTGLSVLCSPSSLVLSSGGSSNSNCTFSSSTPGTYTVTVTGISGAVSHSTVLTISVILDKHDFAISATPTLLLLDPGSSGTANITITGGSVFSRTVYLTLASSPGLTSSLSTSSITSTGSALLTISAGAVGNYTATVTGSTRSGLVHAVTLTIRVVDFSLSVNPTSLTANAGVQTTVTVTVSPINGFNSTVALTTSSSAGLTATLNPSTIIGAGNSVLTLRSSLTGNYTLTVLGTSGPLAHTSSTISVRVVDFTISANPTSVGPLYAGSQGTVTITINGINGFSSVVSLSATSSAGLNASINPSKVTGSGTASLTVSASAAGNYLVTIAGTSDSLSHQTTTVSVSVVDFSMQAPSSTVLNLGNPTTSNVVLSSLNQFTGYLTLSSSASPSFGLTVTCSPSQLVLAPSSSTSSACLIDSTATGTYQVTFTATSGSLVHNVVMTVSIVDFSIAAGPASLTLNAGAQGSSTITIGAINGFSGPVSISSTSAPGLNLLLSSNSLVVSGSVTLTLSSSTTGNYVVNVTATSGSLSHSVLVNVSVVDFTVTASPKNLTFNAGQQGASTVTITGLNGFSGTVSLSATASPGLTASLGSSTVSGSGIATLILTSTTAGNYTVTVTATSGSLSHTITMTVIVGSFSMTVNPTSLSLVQGSPSSFSVTFTSINGFSGTIDLSSAVSKASGISLSCTSSSVVISSSGSSTVTCTATGLSNGNFTISLTAMSGSISQSSSISVRVRQH